MVHFTHLPTFLSLSVLTTFFLASLVESAEYKCDSSIKTTNINSSSIKDKYIVFLNTAADDNSHKEWLDNCWGIKMGSKINSDDKSAYDLTVKGTSIKGYNALFTESFVKKILSKRPEVKLVEKDSSVKINYAIPNNLFKRTVRAKALPNLDRIDQAKFPLDGDYAFPNSAGKGVNIFVVDTGIDTKHSEFEKRAKDGGSFCSPPIECEEGSDGNGHGTHVAGTAGGKTVGVASKANLIAIQVLGSDGSGKNSDVIAGLKSVLDQHIKGKNKNSIVSMSLGGVFSKAVNSVVKSLTDAGIHVVVAAGNEATDACEASPASAPTAITVGALDDSSGKTDEVAFFSNIGKCLDIFAPGVGIKSAKAGTKNGFVLFDGTSQATPHVSGTIALLISEDGNTTPAKMAKKLIGLSTKNLLAKGELQKSPNNILRVPAE